MWLSCRIIPRFRFILIGLLSLAISAVISAQVYSQPAAASPQWGDVVRLLSDKIASALGSSPSIWLEIKNIAGLGPADTQTLQEQFRSELERRGVEIEGDPSAQTQVQITLSEGTEGYVLVAEIRNKSGEQVALVNGPPSGEVDSPQKPVPFLQASELLQQSQPMFDFAQAAEDDGTPLLLLLVPDRLARFQKIGGSWTMHDSAPLPSSHSTSRDLRGRIDLSGPHGLAVFLTGISCTGSWYPTLSLDCHQSDPSEKSPLGVQAGSPISPDRTPQSYFTVSNSVNGHVRWIETKPDGSAQLFENTHEAAVATFSGWGDEIGSIATPCSTAWHVLVTGTGDWTHSDRIQMYEVAGRRGVAIGRPLEISGPVLSLWQSDDGKSARIVSRDLQTGMYEASIVSASCGN